MIVFSSEEPNLASDGGAKGMVWCILWCKIYLIMSWIEPVANQHTVSRSRDNGSFHSTLGSYGIKYVNFLFVC